MKPLIRFIAWSGALLIGGILLKRQLIDKIPAQDSSDSEIDELPSINPISESVIFDVEDSVMYITLNRPEVLNALDLEMVGTLHQLLVQSKDNEAIRAIVITGKGRAFCAGGDLKFAVQANPENPGDSFLALTAVLHACIEEIRTMSKPVIAAINGPAAGAGLFLALACDLRLMAETAYLKQSNTTYGLSLPAGGTFTLPRLVGMGRALEIVMLDEPIAAPKACDLGLVNRIVANEDLLDQAHALAIQTTQMPIGTLGRVKQLMNRAFYNSLNEQLAAEQQAIVLSANSAEGQEGLSAFLQKRRPVYW